MTDRSNIITGLKVIAILAIIVGCVALFISALPVIIPVLLTMVSILLTIMAISFGIGVILAIVWSIGLAVNLLREHKT